MIWRALLILLAALGPAAAAVPEPAGYRMDGYRAPVPDTVAGAAVVHVPQLAALLQQGRAVPVDVLTAPRRPGGMRPEMPWLPPPHEDIPGSLWWPDIGRGAIAPELEATLRERLRQLAAANPGRLIVFYCKSECWLSWNAAKRAAAFGIRAGWLPDGADGWASAGQPLAKATPEFLDEQER